MKNPVRGKVKSRLAKTIGEDAALRVYRDLVEKTRKFTLGVKANRFLYYGDKVEEDEWSGAQFVKRKQTKGDLGLRMEKAFAEVFAGKNEQPTLIIGCDCFDLREDIIEEAYSCLREKDLVIGPANDGGYYLLGMKRLYPPLFSDIEWSSAKVFSATMQQAMKLGLSVKVMEELVDIDTFADLQKSGMIYKQFL
jgi:rSAM/selenodomain-associated transferase 1